MAIQALIFDLGGVLLEFDWERYHKDNNHATSAQDLWPIYEKLNPALMNFLIEIRPDYKLAILSNGGSRDAMQRKFQLHKLFHLMVFDQEEGFTKPDARIYQRTLQLLGIQAQEAVFVDDKIQNIEAARQLGIYGIHFLNTEQAITEIRALLQNP